MAQALSRGFAGACHRLEGVRCRWWRRCLAASCAELPDQGDSRPRWLNRDEENKAPTMREGLPPLAIGAGAHRADPCPSGIPRLRPDRTRHPCKRLRSVISDRSLIGKVLRFFESPRGCRCWSCMPSSSSAHRPASRGSCVRSRVSSRRVAGVGRPGFAEDHGGGDCRKGGSRIGTAQAGADGRRAASDFSTNAYNAMSSALRSSSTSMVASSTEG